MDQSQLRHELKETTQKLLQTINDYPKEKFNIQPPGGGWTTGEVAEHLIKVETGTVRLFVGDHEDCSRNPEEKIPEIKKRLSDFDNKMSASGPITPDKKPKDKQEVLQKLQDIRQRLIGIIGVQDLTKVISDFDHPLFGSLTKIEWLVFTIHHSRRHTHQIKNIARKLAGK